MNSTELLEFLPCVLKEGTTFAIAIPEAAPQNAKRLEALCMICIQQTAADMLLTKKPQRFTVKDDSGTYSTVVADIRRLAKDEHYRALFCKMAALFSEVREVKFF